MDSMQYNSILEEYKSSCEYLKQICSNKANKYYKYNKFFTTVTIIASIVLSSIAFAGKETILMFYSTLTDNNETNIQGLTSGYDIGYNMIVLFIVILSIINILYKFQERSTDYFQTVTALSSMIRDIDNLQKSCIDDKIFSEEFNIIKIKYNTMLNYLPPHTDKDFIRAKYKLKIKKEISEQIKNRNILKVRILFTKITLGIFLENK